MNVVIFDVDGTLTQTTRVDDESLAAAFGRFFGVPLPRVDWHEFGVSTDQGLLTEVSRRVRGRGPDDDESARARAVFLEELARRIDADALRCLAVPGAEAVIERLQGLGWRVGLASGAWAESAALKLARAGVGTHDVPGTFSHAHADGRPADREEIISATLGRLIGTERPRRVVYVGDGVWDARASRRLGIGFVGLRHDGQDGALRGEGTGAIHRDLRDVDALAASLERAVPPAGSGA